MSNRFDIGFITSGYRTILDGKEYDQFFTGPEDRDRIIIKDGDVDATVDLMKRVVWKYIDDTKRISAHLKASTLKQTCENIWNFLFHHIQYKLDKKGLEQLRRPNRSWAERQTGIDCDCFSIFVSSILTNFKIQHSFRIARYNKDVFQHVYVIVPIPGENGYYTIDCVLNQFNYEKPFTEKKDFPMNMQGINVAVLSGTDDNVLDIISGLEETELLGATEADRSKAIYEHLVRTRNLIAQKPYLIAQVDYPPAFLKMLDYAIEHWNTPNQIAALENLGRNEDELNRLNGMYGVPDDTDFDGADEDWEHLEGLSASEIDEELNGKARKAKRAAKKAAKKANPKKAKKGFFRKVGQAVKKGVKAVVRFNPLSIAARNGFLLAMKLNLKKMASKLKWGYATQGQAAAKGISTQQWQKSKNALAKIEKLFADRLQGKRSALKNAILKGKAGGINGLGGDEEVDFLGVAPAAAVAAAVPVITAALKIMVDSGLMKKGEAQNVEQETNAKASEAETTATESTPVAVEPITQQQPEASLPIPSSTSVPEPVITPQESTPSPSIVEENVPEAAPAVPVTEEPVQEIMPQETNEPTVSSEETVIPEETTESSAEPAEVSEEGVPAPEDESQGGFLGFVAAQPAIALGGLALGIWGLSSLFSNKEETKSRSALSGTTRQRKGKKTSKAKSKTKKQKRGKGGKLKAITLK
jgi:hypothetical protein